MLPAAYEQREAIGDPGVYDTWRVGEDFSVDLSRQEQRCLPYDWMIEPLEIASPKFSLTDDNWQDQLSTVLATLQQLESQECFVATNHSTGLHVHVGHQDGPIPLATAKNVFQLGTAFERCLDQLSTTYRLKEPEFWGDFMYGLPPSVLFRHRGSKDSATRRNIFDWLRQIESKHTYEELSDTCVSQLEMCSVWAHNSAYNFENLFAAVERNRRPIGTIEFRQHAGSLDHPEIVAWTLLVCYLVKFAATTPKLTLLQLIVRATDGSFSTADFLRTLRLDDTVSQHFFSPERFTTHSKAGVVSRAARRLVQTIEQSNASVNDLGAVQAAIVQKMVQDKYGYQISYSEGDAASVLETLWNEHEDELTSRGHDMTAYEDGITRASFRILEWLADQYRDCWDIEE
jgi:hypothetical protein